MQSTEGGPHINSNLEGNLRATCSGGPNLGKCKTPEAEIRLRGRCKGPSLLLSLELHGQVDLQEANCVGVGDGVISGRFAADQIVA